MNRREALGMLGVLTAGFTVLAGVEAHAEEGHAQHEQTDQCARACADCQIDCDSCFHHCAELIATGDKTYAKAMRLCVDCADLCATAARLVSRQSPLCTLACEACAKACDECAAECEKFPSDKQLAGCAQSCRNCAKACRDMINRMHH
jgi:hypothetical protein